MLHQQGDVRLALPQRREMDGDDVDAVVEVAAHGPFIDPLEEIPVRGRDDAHIRAVDLGAADRRKTPVLDGAEQLHLPHEADFTQFIEEKRAPVGLIQIPFLVGRRTGERTLLVAEQLAFKEAFRDGPAVDRHKGLLIPGAAVVDGPGRQFLACPRFAVNDHVVVHGRRFGDEIEDGGDLRRIAHDVA